MTAEPIHSADEPRRLVGRRQRVVRARRQYNQWAANQTLEDYALRFTAEGARRWPLSRIANTALGSIAFLACEAVGAAITLEFGFTNALAALIAMSGVIVLTGFPICYYAARYGVDMDLLTRGSGFGYIGSTITSAIYAGFTFILFAIEAAILSAALELCFGVPLPLGYVISALVVIPIAAYGVRRISWIQTWTQPVWLILQLAPIAYLVANAGKLDGWTSFSPSAVAGFNLAMFGSASAVLLSLLPQIGEQVDYLRFLPAKHPGARGRGWWAALTLAGPGWIVIGGAKILLGSALAYIALRQGMDVARATAPADLYNLVFQDLVGSPATALILTGLFVAVCQVKINITNGYAGSIAASNFFSRLTHRHPGRVVWLVFNISVALFLMEVGIVNVVAKILAIYANFAVAWIGAVTADLVINKPLGLSPKGIEFKRAHLYDINPVGVGAMAASLTVSTMLSLGGLGTVAQALAPLVGLAVAFAVAPTIAWATHGRYYLAREDSLKAPAGSGLVCTVCENAFERPDMAFCPVYDGPICSLCCTLEARCHDACKESSQVVEQAAGLLRHIAPAPLTEGGYAVVARFLGVLLVSALALWGVLAAIYYHQAGGSTDPGAIRETLAMVFLALFSLAAFAGWFFVLARENQRVAESETDRQTAMLLEEIEAHQRTDAALQKAKEVAEHANLAKSRYIVGVSHEIRAPLNAISGYAQLLERDPADAADAARVIRRSATHLSDLVNGLLDISRIENGSLQLERSRVNLVELLSQLVDMFRLQAASKGLTFRHSWPETLPTYIYADEKRLRQILINLLSNAIKYTDSGEAALTVRWRGQTAEFVVSDTGMGIAQPDLERIFEPFERLGRASGRPGVGLGLTITKVLTVVLGGDITVRSEPGVGSAFTVKLLLSETPPPDERPADALRISGYSGRVRRILATDDDPTHIDLVRRFLQPVGFELAFARDGAQALQSARREPPDLVIMDIAMPGMNGWEAARVLRAEHGDALSILMVSANAHDFSRGWRQDAPHDDYLLKPYEADDLFDRIRTLLDLEWTHADREVAE